LGMSKTLLTVTMRSRDVRLTLTSGSI
jgi:hypothetical protein